MRCSVVAVGTELLLGQIVDTNSSWIGEQLAANGIDSLLQVKVGDNHQRIVDVVRSALREADAVIMCGGLGPTHDDLTREAIAEVMGVDLVMHDDIAEVIRNIFESRGRRMADNNLQQAMVPVGATVIHQTRGTAPGLMCPVGDKVIYAVPGVPHEMQDMMERAILPDLRARSGDTSVIVSRVIRTWGESESGLNERLNPIFAQLEEVGNPTLAFLASGWEGNKVRLTAKGADSKQAHAVLDEWQAKVLDLVGDVVCDDSADHGEMDNRSHRWLRECERMRTEYFEISSMDSDTIEYQDSLRREIEIRYPLLSKMLDLRDPRAMAHLSWDAGNAVTTFLSYFSDEGEIKPS